MKKINGVSVLEGLELPQSIAEFNVMSVNRACTAWLKKRGILVTLRDVIRADAKEAKDKRK